jgi:hypothetical protein
LAETNQTEGDPGKAKSRKAGSKERREGDEKKNKDIVFVSVIHYI